MTFNPHTEGDRVAMLEATGVDAVEEFFAPVPQRVRFPELDLPPLLTELEATDHLAAFAARNATAAAEDVYLGAGSYRHFIPAAVGQILARGEFYTAYTPYQPEVSQGTLQVIYEFQSLVAALTGMDVANASMYDGATALAEGALMTVSSSRGRRRIVISPTVHPAYRDVLRTYLEGLDLDLVEMPLANSGFMTAPDDIAPYLTDDLACVVVQYPNFFGGIEAIAEMAELAHARGGALVVSTYPVPLGLLRAPRTPGGRRRRGGGAGARGATGVRRSLRWAPRLTTILCETDAGAAGRDDKRHRGQAGIRVDPADARAAHPTGEGDVQYLYESGADGNRRHRLHGDTGSGRLPRGGTPELPERALSRRPGE